LFVLGVILSAAKDPDEPSHHPYIHSLSNQNAAHHRRMSGETEEAGAFRPLKSIVAKAGFSPAPLPLLLSFVKGTASEPVLSEAEWMP